jgi:hypothetical protein
LCPPGVSRIIPDRLHERAFSPGVYTVLAWQEYEEWYVALQRRGTRVFVHPDRYSIIPSYILQPTSTPTGGRLLNADAHSDCSLWLNFLREYF